jgi:chitinase
MVMNLDAMVTRMGLDGVDVDIERGNEMKSNGNFPQFLSTLQTTLHGHGKLVTAATAQYIVEDSGTDAGVIAYLKSYDFVNLMIYAFDADMHKYTSELSWWDTKIGMPKTKLTWGIEFDPALNTSLAAKLTTASKADGGVMIWEYSQGTEKTLWPAVQSVL